MKTLVFTLLYVISLIPGLLVAALGDGHWCAWVLGAFVSSAYYRYIAPEDAK
ncbi:hypothetical protein D3C81_1904220 [compost metagenome]